METITGSIQKLKEIRECCSTRDVLWYLVFTGFAVNYMIRINLNIALVSMVQPRPKSDVILTSECLDEYGRTFESSNVSISLRKNLQDLEENVTLTNRSQEEMSMITANVVLTTLTPNNVLSNATPATSSINDSTLKSHFASLNADILKRLFDWNEKVQGSILGSYYWLHWITQIPGGILAAKYGTKLIFGMSNFAGVILCFAIPLFAKWGPWYLIALRTIQGLVTGFAWPAMHNMTARWIPPNERSKFVTAYLGSSVGAAITYPLCGFIINLCGWEYVFYVCGVLGTLWFVAWCLLVYDSPSEHPRISENEKEFIVRSLGQSVARKTAPVPWIKILTNITVWMNILAQWGGVWGLFTLMTYAPAYFKFIHGWNIKATGLLSGMPHLLRMVWAYFFSLLGDYLLRSNKMSRSNVRKLATAVCCIGQGVFMLLLAYSGCDRTAAILYLTAAVAIHGAVSTGPLASVVDVSPNYASVILGIINTSVACVGFFTPLVVGQLTYQNQTVKQWQKVFWIATGMLFTSGIFYTIFAKSELQPWNSPDTQNSLPENEMMILRKEKEALDSNKGEKIKEEQVKMLYLSEQK